MTEILETRFTIERSVLDTLFGREAVEHQLPRLNAIFEHTEQKWHEYVETIPAQCVRFLLIAEAPPWSSEGPPPYVLDPVSKARTLMRALRSAFLPDASPTTTPAEVLRYLAARGFLVLDTIPFAMKYLSWQRSRPAYSELVRLSVGSYLLDKANSSGISWSENLRIAFALRTNARAIMAAGKALRLGGRDWPLSEDMIAVNGANYPDAKKLRRLYGLE